MSTTEPPAPTVPRYIEAMNFPESGIRAESVYLSPLSPRSMRLGPTGQLLVLGDDTTIYEIADGGNPTPFAALDQLGSLVTQFGFDPEGRLWASSDRGLFLVEDSGEARLVAGPDVNREFVIDSSGNLYAVDYPGTTVQRIAPDGEVTVVAADFDEAHKIALTTDDRILIIESSRGELILVEPDGGWRTLVAGLSIDFGIAVAPDGTVYLIDWSGLYLVDMEAGTMARVRWYEPYRGTAENGIFDQNGILYTYHPNVPIYRVDLESQTAVVVLDPRANTFAMAVGPDARVFAAYGDRIPGGATRLFEVGDANTLHLIASVPYREPVFISFDGNGDGLLAVRGPTNETDPTSPTFYGGALYRFRTDDSDLEIVLSYCCGSYESVVEDPVTGEIWWAVPDGLLVLDADRAFHKIPFPETGITTTRLEFTDQGRLYGLFSRRGGATSLAGWWLYQLDGGRSGSWELLYAAIDSPTSALDFAICGNDALYLFGVALDGGIIDSRWRGPLTVLWQLVDGELVVLGYPVGQDNFAQDCDVPTNAIYFTTLEGIGKVVIDSDR